MYCGLLEISHLHCGLALCLSPCLPLSTSLLHFSFSFSQRSFPFRPFFSFPTSHFPLCPRCLVFHSFTPPPSFYPRVPFYISASLRHSDSFLLCFTLLHGQVAEQLAYHVHVSESVITEETFDAAVQFGKVQGDPTPSWAGWPVCMPPWSPSAPTGKRAWKDNDTTSMCRSLVSLTGGYLSGRERDSSPSNNTW